jgi:hypothetical protein
MVRSSDEKQTEQMVNVTGEQSGGDVDSSTGMYSLNATCCQCAITHLHGEKM